MITTDHNKLAHRLGKKEWDNHHIAKTLHIIKKAKHKRLDKFVYWTALFVAITGNMFILAGITPLMIEMPQIFVFLFVATIGVCFGMLIDVIIRELDEISIKHYVIAGILIPVIATITVFVVIGVAKSMAIKVGLSLKANPLFVAIIYLISFAAPHLIFKIKERKEFFSLEK